MVLLVLAEGFDDGLVTGVSDAEEPEFELFGSFVLELSDPDVCTEAVVEAVVKAEADTEGVIAVVVVASGTVVVVVAVVAEVVLASTLEPVISIKVKTDITKAVAIRSDAPWTRILSVCSYKL